MRSAARDLNLNSVHSASTAPSHSSIPPLTRRAGLALAAIVAAGFTLRIVYLLIAVRTPGFVWADPDGYLHNALLLARPDGWHWSFDVAKYIAGGRVYALPALYSIFLSLVAIFPGMPFTAQVAQIVLSTIAIVLVFMLGRFLHSPAAGLWASGAYAASFPNIFNVWSTSQESLYIPLVLAAFVLYARALLAGRAAAFAASGVAFGLAALTRSMPLFFMLPFALLHVAAAADRRAALRQAAACLAGFCLVVVPYCIGLSMELGQLTIIDSHTGFAVEGDSGNQQAAPGILRTAEALWRLVAGDPLGYMRSAGERIRTLLYVNGGRLLQIYVVAGSAATAVMWKALVHVGTDVLLVAAAILVWPGALLCRNGRLALAFLLWAAVNVGIVALSGFGGARLRSPFEPLLLVVGSVVLAGGWRRRPLLAIAGSLVLALLTARIVVPQLPRSFRSWPDYAIEWPSVLDRRSGVIHGSGALNVPAFTGTAWLRAGPIDPRVPIDVEVQADGVIVRSLRLEGDAAAISWPWSRGGFAFAELRAIDARTQAPAAIRIELGRR